MPDVTITPTEDGPYMVSGPVRLVAPDGMRSSTPIRWWCAAAGMPPRTSRFATARTPRSTSRHAGEL